MAHAQKADFVFRRNGRVHLNRRGTSVQSTTGSRGVHINGSNVGYTMFRGSVKSTGYPPHSPVFPSLPLPCVTVYHHVSTGLYRDSFPWVKAAELVVDRSSSAEVKNEWSCTSVTHICIHCRDRDDFTLTSVGFEKCIV
jgi:hypothetical protein